MISDVLSDAVAKIDAYRRDPVYVNWYCGLARELQIVTTFMDALRVYLDADPAPGDERICTAIREASDVADRVRAVVDTLIGDARRARALMDFVDEVTPTVNDADDQPF